MDRVELRFQVGDGLKAEALLRALEPDNRIVPKGLTIRGSVSDSTLLIEMESNVKVETLLNTVDDLLICLSTAERCLDSVTGIEGLKGNV